MRVSDVARSVALGAATAGVLVAMLVESKDSAGRVGPMEFCRIAAVVGIVFTAARFILPRVGHLAEQFPIGASVGLLMTQATLLLLFPYLAGVDYLIDIGTSKVLSVYVGFGSVGLIYGLWARRHLGVADADETEPGSGGPSQDL